MKSMKTSLVALLAVTAVSLATAQSASATTILVFGQGGTTNTINSTNNGAGLTTFSGTDVAVTITGMENQVGNVAAFLDFTATNTGAATALNGNINQAYGGSFSICSTAIGCTINYLSGTFSDQASGAVGGNQLTLGASQPSDTVNFTENGPITSLDPNRSLSFAFTNLSSPLAIVNGSINSFTASVAGNMSANVGVTTPEPMSLMLLGSGLLALGRRRFRKNS
jgi:hypothetical protein